MISNLKITDNCVYLIILSQCPIQAVFLATGMDNWRSRPLASCRYDNNLFAAISDGIWTWIGEIDTCYKRCFFVFYLLLDTSNDHPAFVIMRCACPSTSWVKIQDFFSSNSELNDKYEQFATSSLKQKSTVIHDICHFHDFLPSQFCDNRNNPPKH